MIDYKELLRKYIQHVYASEGCNFAPGTMTWSGVEFTEEEIKAWEELEYPPPRKDRI